MGYFVGQTPNRVTSLMMDQIKKIHHKNLKKCAEESFQMVRHIRHVDDLIDFQ